MNRSVQNKHAITLCNINNFIFSLQPSAFSLGDLCVPPMANVLKVFLENGQTKSFKYDNSTTVQVKFELKLSPFHIINHIIELQQFNEVKVPLKTINFNFIFCEIK